jgi:putative transposase
MRNSGKKLNDKKINAIMERMDCSLKGARRIANVFNKRRMARGKDVSIGRSHAYNILKKEGLIHRKKKKQRKSGRRTKRPEEPFKEFAMDFGEKPLAGGGRLKFLPLMDLYDNAFVLLDAHDNQSGRAVVTSLSRFRKVFKGKVKITVDNGKEFKNSDVTDYCDEKDILLNFIEKGCPWMNPFAERAIRTIKEEYLNLIWIDTDSDKQAILNDIKHSYNRRDNMAFGFQSPLQVLGNHFK